MFRNRLMEIMTSSSPYPVASAATFLWGVSKLYGGAARLRRKLYEHQVLTSRSLPCPVVSVGNLALGGTGKTPMVIHLARMIQGMGLRPAIISRGYKGTAQNKGAIVSDGHTLNCRVSQSGDEPYLMAMLLESVPVVVGKDRYAAGKTAIEQFNPDLLLLDDAFQHLRLKRDLNLLLLDARRPFGNSHIFPRGRLREPIGALSNADAVILTRSDRGSGRDNVSRAVGEQHQIPVFRTRHRGIIRGVAPGSGPLASPAKLHDCGHNLKGLKLFGFAGLADNQAFFDTVQDLGGRLHGTLSFDDHHAYGDTAIRQITAAATDAGADRLITTDKDYVRLFDQARFTLEVIVVGADLDFMEDATRWEAFIAERIKFLVDRRKVA